MSDSSLVLLSAGLDSLASFYWALENTHLQLALTFDYGQKAAAKEIAKASQIAGDSQIKHQVLKLDCFSQFDSSSLINKAASLPQLAVPELDDDKATQASAQAVWVPNRNGVFINMAAALAEDKGITRVVVGFNQEEGATFPDNTLEFVQAINAALKYSTQEKVSVMAPMIDKTKTQMVSWLMQHKADLSHLWSCYLGGERMCGQCESCLRLQRGLQQGGGELWLERLFGS